MSEGGKPSESTLEQIKVLCVGKSIAEVTSLAESGGWRVRIRRRDGMPMLGTCDICWNRINVVVDNGIVTDIVGFG